MLPEDQRPKIPKRNNQRSWVDIVGGDRKRKTGDRSYADIVKGNIMECATQERI